MPKVQSFTLSRYTEPVASALALYWCHKMQTLYTVWLLAGEDPGFVFKPEDLVSSNEWEHFEEEFGGLPANSPGRARITLIQQIVPRL